MTKLKTDLLTSYRAFASWLLIATFALPVLLHSPCARGSDSSEWQLFSTDPRTQWEQLDTDHFRIIYDSKHYQLALAYAKFAEQAFAADAPVFRVWPERTVIVLNDEGDSANGNAIEIPFPLINAYPVLPTASDDIGDYGNWGLELLLHEYTHILTFEPVNGIFKPLRYLFGNVARPNQYLPTWYLEGLAVEMETLYSKHGRLRSAGFLSEPRAMVAEGTLRKEDISRINEQIPDWPGGNRRYLIGSLMWNEEVRLKGIKIIGDLNLAYSRQVPSFINGPLQDEIGMSYAQLLGQVYTRIETKANEQIRLIQAGSKENGRKFDQVGFFSQGPQISPDLKKLIWVGRSHNLSGFVTLVERENTEESFLKSKTDIAVKAIEGETNRASWLPDSESFIYDHIHTFDRYYTYSDLWRYDLKDKKVTQLTKGLRAREPVVSKDGKYIVFVQNYPGGTRLSSVPIAGGEKVNDLFSPTMQIRIEYPEFLDPHTLIFSLRTEDGIETFKRLPIVEKDGHLEAAGPVTDVLTTFKPVHFAHMTKKGLLFVSDRTGVANLYLANPGLTDAVAVTNTTTKVMTGELDPGTGELLYSRLYSAGPQLYVDEQADWSKVPAQPPQVAQIVDNDWPTYTAPEIEVHPKKSDYAPFGYLLPTYWKPYMALLPNGYFFSASTQASDPVGRHSYNLTAAYDTLTNKPSFYGQYINQTTPYPVTLTGIDAWEYLYTGNLSRHDSMLNATVSSFIPHLSNHWMAGLGWQYAQTEVFNLTAVRNGPSLSFGYRNISQSGLEISPEKGGMFSVTDTEYIPTLGNTHYNETDFTGAYYFSKWLPERHVLAFLTSGVLAPKLNNLALGTTTIGGSYQTNLVTTGLLMRGYLSGYFIGRDVVTTNVEYRFPISYQYRGFDTYPFFLSRLHGNVFVDTVTLDGDIYRPDLLAYQRVKMGRFFVGTGTEIRADTTIFYQWPVQFILGLYYGLDRQVNNSGLIPFLGVVL